MIKILKGECIEELKKIDKSNKILVIDPPFNVGYHYNEYHDKKPEKEYLQWLENIINGFKGFVIIHYPESIFKLSMHLGIVPTKTVSWVYNSNTKKQHRMIAYFNIKPDFNLVKQPYKNPNDKRIKQRIANGSKGSRLYDWWEINQVKNVSKKDITHPCVMPIEVMKRVVGIIPGNETIVDCFSGSGTTAIACKLMNKNFIGIELNEIYYEESIKRLSLF